MKYRRNTAKVRNHARCCWENKPFLMMDKKKNKTKCFNSWTFKRFRTWP